MLTTFQTYYFGSLQTTQKNSQRGVLDMLNQHDIHMLESLNYYNEQQETERKAMRDYNQLVRYQQFKADMLQYGDFTEEELQEMWEAEQLVEHDL